MQDCGALLFCGIGCVPVSKAGTNHRPERSFFYLYAPVRKKFSDVFHLVGGILDHQFAACGYGEQSCFGRANTAVFLRCIGVPFLVFGGADLRYSADGYRFSVGSQISGAIVCPAMDIQVYSIYVQMDSGGGDRMPWTTLYWDSIRNTLSCAVPMMTIGIFCWQDHRKKMNCQWRNWTIVHAVLNMSELTLLYFLSPQKLHFEYLISMPALVYCFVNWLLTLKFRFQNREIPGMLRKASVWIYCSHVAFIVIFGWFHTSQGLRRFVVVAGGLAIATVLHVLPCYVKRKR